jgi:hypothetical protein
MLKQLAQISLIASAATLLAACGYNPQTTPVSPTQSCITMQHRMLFADQTNPAGKSPTDMVNQHQALEKQFQDQHCYRILAQARKGEPTK